MRGNSKEGKDQLSSATTKKAPDADADANDDTKPSINRMKEDDNSVGFRTPEENVDKATNAGTEEKEEISPTQLSASNIPSSTLSLSLHDCISLGEIELGLKRREIIYNNDKVISDCDRLDGNTSRRQEEYLRHVEEVRRLPYLLRLLSSTQPLASIKSFEAFKSKSEGEIADTSSKANDEYLDRIVDLLEDAAATYSVAGAIDVVTNHLAPSVAKNISRLPPLLKTHVGYKNDNNNNRNHEDYCWDTENLAAIARNPVAKRKRRKKDSLLCSSKKTKHEKDEIETKTHDSTTVIEDTLGTTSDEDENIESMDITLGERTEDRQTSSKRRDSMKVAAEDSQESTVIKTLSELASLVVASLMHRSNCDVEGEDDQQQHHGSGNGGRRFSSLLSLNTDDILSENVASISRTGRLGAGDVGGGAIEGNDLSSTIVAIMHNAPVLRSKHAANAFCRASVPQAGDLISRLGANCPESVPPLLLGCIEAYSMSVEYHHRDYNDGICSSNDSNIKASLSCPVVTAAKSAIIALANLSQKESCRVQNKLQSLGIMIDIQLKLVLDEGIKALSATKTVTGVIPIACLLIEHLSFPAATDVEAEGIHSSTSNIRTAIADPLEERSNSEVMQAHGDTNIDSTHNKLVFEYATACSKGAEPSLLLHFVLKPDLYMQVLEFFSRIMALGASTSPSFPGGIKKSFGKWSLIMRAYSLLLLVSIPKSTASSASDLRVSYKNCIEPFVALIQNLDSSCDKRMEIRSGEKPKMSKMDTLASLVSSCAVLLLSRNLASRQENEEQEEMEVTIQLMRTIFKILESTSKQSNMLRISLEDQLRMNDTWGVFKRVLYPLEIDSNIQESYANNSYHSQQIGLKRFCKRVWPVLKDRENKIKLDISFNVGFRLHALRRELESPNELLVEETKGFLASILNEESENETLSLMENVETAQFVVEATNFLVKSDSSEIPLVLPAHIDIAWSKIAYKWKISDTKPTDGRRCNFLFRLLYAFIFLDKSPLSPFAFDPRSSPIKESLIMVQNISSKSTRKYLISEIQVLIQNHCPELIIYRFMQNLDHRESPPFDNMDRKSILSTLCNAIQTHLHKNNTLLRENRTEYLFLLAKARICDSDVYSAVTNAFLSSSHAPSPTYSYHILCRDPIVCLKFPLSVWKCRALRRIALSVLENLISSNNSITLEKSRLEDTALELLVARDAIIVRCLLAVLHGGESKNLVICSMTTSFIRWMIQGRSGLVALIVKQGIQERHLDWFIENVPETMNDSQYLLQIFSERNSLTGAERLVAADAAIRIAIVHGRANEIAACQLILTAVSQLVDYFYLIIGPVGLLPVDALFNAESGTPITQTSQKAAFRILKSMTKLKVVRNHFRRDCSMMLQKLINLCKGELQVAAAGRRKQLVKELYDAALKVEK